MHVLGTAGHVDHGKSSLVRALTGTDPDRWIEERLRGMTLDLGFAHLRFPDGVEAGVVDVPGHERFLHNMLAGAAGMELLLLVVAANEGPRPQTLEHLAILQYLNVKRTIVVLSKSDTVDADELAFADELVREALAGSFAAGAPVVPVSTVTGAGLEALRTAIHEALVALPPRAPAAPAYLPIDRVFALAGHGTIVTGTLMQGRIGVGDELALAPLDRAVRVRSLQVFGAKRERVDGGARVAVNLPGVETGEVRRGAVLASPQFARHASVAVSVRPYAPSLPILRRRTPVRAYLGAAEILGTLVFERVPASAESVGATLYLREPAIAFPGAAFVVRRLSPKTLLGGGIVAAAGGERLAVSDDPPDVAAVRDALHRAGLGGTTPARAGAAANVREDRAAEILTQLADDGRAVRLHKPVAFADAELLAELFDRVDAQLARGEEATPWVGGATALALARALGVGEPVLTRALAVAVEDGRFVVRSGYYATPRFAPTLTPEQRAFFDGIFQADPAQPNVPVALEAVTLGLRTAKIAGLAQAYETLLATGALVKVQDAVYRGEQLAAIRIKLETALRRDKEIAPAAFRDLIGTSRKYAVPLLEWFDGAGVTIRSGDVRVLRVTPQRPPART